MKTTRLQIFGILIVILLLCVSMPFAVTEDMDLSDSVFHGNVTVVPRGTEVRFTGDNTVVIKDSPVEIREGDTFVVYLQDLPVGYVAKQVNDDGGQTVITAAKADKSIYAGMNESGEVRLTGKDYEFVRSRGPLPSGLNFKFLDALKYEDGALKVKVEIDDGLEISLKLSDMRLYYSFSAEEIRLGMAGNWELGISSNTQGMDIGEFEIGEARIYGIGKIKLSVNLGMTVETSFAGTFDTGLLVDGAGGHLIRDFSAAKTSEGVKGSVTASVKLTAGLDFLIAEADLFAELGIRTHIQSQHTEHTDRNPPVTVDCTDYKMHVFLTVGAEVKYQTGLGKTKTLASADFDLLDNIAPSVIDIHFENGERVGACTEGMDTTSPVAYYGGITSGFDSDLLTGSRDRIIDKDIGLPWDIEVDDDLYLGGGNLHLNGFTLTIHGDLIHSGGTLIVDNGKLIIDGDYKFQSEAEDGKFGDSTGILDMGNEKGTVSIGGNLIIQTTKQQTIVSGSILLKGSIFQYDPAEGTCQFYTGYNCPVTLVEGSEHSANFADIEHNAIGLLILQTDLTADNMVVGTMEMNGHSLNVRQNLRTTGDNDLKGCSVSVGGNYYQNGGTLTIGGGKLSVTGNYYIADANSLSDYSARKFMNVRAYLHMQDPADVITVGGDFVIASHGGHPYGKDVSIVIGGRYENLLSEGVMYIGGDFYQSLKDSPYSDSLFWPTDNHLVVFNGTGVQTIHCDSAGNGFQNVEFRNTDIRLTGHYLRGFTLNQDLNLILDTDSIFFSGEMNLNGHTLGLTSIPGDFTLEGGGLTSTVPCKLTIDGSLALEGDFGLLVKNMDLTVNGALKMFGYIGLENSTMSVKQSAHLWAGRSLLLCDSVMDIGESLYITASNREEIAAGKYYMSDCYVELNTKKSLLRIGKDLIWASRSFASSARLDAGVVCLGGNFRQVVDSEMGWGGGSFYAKDDFIFVLCGSGQQTVTFDEGAGNPSLGTVVLTRAKSNYTFSDDPCWATLCDVIDSPDLTVPVSMNAIPESGYEGTEAATVYIPDSCESIGKNAFKDSSVLAARIPAACSVDDSAFSGCEFVVVFGTKGSPAEEFCNKHSRSYFAIDYESGNPDKIQAFVTRCYKLILNRDADEGGLQGWSEALKGKSATAAQIIDGFVRSEEFTNRNLSNDAKVDILYKTMLNREADADGKAGWVDALSKGYTLQNIIDGFCGSPEFKAICDSYGIEPGSVGAATPADTSTPRGKIEAFVKRCYSLILSRDADEGGLKGWSDALESRQAAAAQIIDGFVRSEEYTNRKLSAGESVDILYKTMLDRNADEGGRAGWVDALGQGYTLQHIINGFCGSAEFTAICNNYGIVAGSVAVSGVVVKREAITPEGEEAAPVVYQGYNSVFINEEKIKAFVEHCYVTVFGREGDGEGVANYTSLILYGKKTPKRVAYEFIFSPEFQNNLPGNEEFIRILYRLYFDREPGTEELAGWVTMLEDGASLEEIVNGFAGSAEFKGIVNEMK